MSGHVVVTVSEVAEVVTIADGVVAAAGAAPNARQ